MPISQKFKSLPLVALFVLIISLAMPLQPVTAATTSEGALKEATGGTSALLAYTSCFYIGEVADALAAGRYSAQEVNIRVSAMLGGLNVAVKQLQAVLDRTTLTPSDRKVIGEMVTILKTIDRQGKSLVRYAQNKTSANAQYYRDARREAWNKILNVFKMHSIADKLYPGGVNLGR
jgi:hypothetical protein